MSCYKPKRKTASGVEEVTLPIASIKGLQTELDNLGNKTIDKIDYLAIESPEVAMELHNMDATAYAREDGVKYSTMCEISSDINDSEVTYAFPMSMHIPLVPGDNVSLEENESGTAIAISAPMKMPIIRVANAYDKNGTMIINPDNPLTISIEIVCGKLKVGDDMQICTRQLFTYDKGTRRKYRLRNQWHTKITEDNVNSRFIYVTIKDTPTGEFNRLFRTGSHGTKGTTLSPIYVRVRRPILSDDGIERDGTFSNIVTVWKKYDRQSGKIYVK